MDGELERSHRFRGTSRNHIERGGGEDCAATIGLYSEPTQRSLFFQLILLLFWVDGRQPFPCRITSGLPVIRPMGRPSDRIARNMKRSPQRPSLPPLPRAD